MKKQPVFRAIMYILSVALLLSCSLSTAALEMPYEPSEAYRQSKYYTALTDIELTGHYPTDIVNVAMSQLGYHEGDTLAELGGGNIFGKENMTEFGAYHGCLDAWCAMFVSWCARQAHIPESLFHTSLCADADDFGLEYRKCYEYTPKMGDIVFSTGSLTASIFRCQPVRTAITPRSSITSMTTIFTMSTEISAIGCRSTIWRGMTSI